MVIDPIWMITQYLQATLGYLMNRPARSPDKPGLRDVGHRPCGAAVEDADAALDHLLLVLVSDADLGGDPPANLVDGAGLSVLHAPPTRPQERLGIQDRAAGRG